jgi:hypothetical protein
VVDLARRCSLHRLQGCGPAADRLEGATTDGHRTYANEMADPHRKAANFIRPIEALFLDRHAVQGSSAFAQRVKPHVDPTEVTLALWVGRCRGASAIGGESVALSCERNGDRVGDDNAGLGTAGLSPHAPDPPMLLGLYPYSYP